MPDQHPSPSESTETMFWYRRVDAVARYPDFRADGRFITVKLSHEEALDVDYSEHVGRVADLLERCGVNDDMGEGSTITFRISYRGDPR